MNQQTFARRVVSIVVVLALAVLVVIIFSRTATGAVLFDSPLATPFAMFNSPITTPTPKPPPSSAAQQARAYIAKRKGIPAASLDIVADHRTEYPALARQFQVITLVDTRPQGEVYKLLVDLQSGHVEENISALLAAEAGAYRSRYGKLEADLYERLQSLRENDVLPVAIWVAATPGQSLADLQRMAFSALAAKYPEAQAAIARSGIPMDVPDPQLAESLEAEYSALLTAQVETRVRPLVTELRGQGVAVTVYAGMPSVGAVLPKRMILELAQRSDVSAIFLTETEVHPELDSAVPSSLAPRVWARGYDGTGTTIAILEGRNVDPTNSYLHHAAISRTTSLGVQDHTTVVASAAASNHATYTGVAYGATVLSAGHETSQTDVISALQWAFDNGAQVVNISEGYEADNNLHWLDQSFDYWSRARLRMITKSAGNIGGSITTPGKAWNVITVGASDDQNNADWFDDTMWTSSSYVNPTSPNNDREKPEVVAVGASITALAGSNAVQTWSGTSMAAPQVAGLTALLIERSSDLQYYPVAAKAIIMASATHNITGPKIIQQGHGDLYDGAGAINAELADTVAQFRADVNTTCTTSCWWGHYIDSNFALGTDLERAIYAEKDDLIRVTIAWLSNADTPGNNYSFDRLDTDLDLRIKLANGQYVNGVYSLSYDNNYEMVEFMAPQTGTYNIAVRKVRADEPNNWLGIAFVRIHNRNYLPLVLKQPAPTPTVCLDC